MDTLIKYLIEWFKESKKVNIFIIILWFLLSILLFWLSYYLRENSEYASALLNGSMFLFWISFIYFLLYLSYEWKIATYKNIKERIDNIKNLLKNLLKEKKLDIKINNREVWESYWTLFSKGEAKFLYMLDENNDLISINLYFKDKKQKEQIEEKLKWKFISKEDLKNYTSVPNNTIILDTLRDLQNKEDEKIVEEIVKLLKYID